MKFDNIETYKNFLGNRLKEISKQGDFDVYLHLVDVFSKDYDSRKTEDEIIEDKALSILSNGLYLNASTFFPITYSSLNGTSKFVGQASALNIDDVIDYSYNKSKDFNRVVVLIAIPKKVLYKGNEIEFSSLDGIHEMTENAFKQNEKFQEEFKNCDDFRFTRLSLFDCTLRTIVPKEYIFGVQKIMPEKGLASFGENKNHICNLSKDKFAELNEIVEKKLEGLGLKNDGSNAIEIMGEASRSDNRYYTQRMLEDF